MSKHPSLVLMSIIFVSLVSGTAFAQTPTPGPTPDPPTVPMNELELSKPTSSNFVIAQWLSADVLGAIPTENAVPAQERFRFRTLDVGVTLKLDEFTSLTLDYGGRDSNGALVLKLREGYLEDVTDRVTTRLGSFFLGVGLLNRMPSNLWPFTSAPISHTEFYTDERIYDSGVEVTVRVNERLSLGAGVTNGYWYGTAPVSGGDKPLTPTHFARPSFFVPVGDGRVDIAIDYLSRVDFTGERMRTSGLEVEFVRGPKDDPVWMTWLEVNHKYRQPAGLSIEETLGGYLYNQARVNEGWSAGVRFDAVTIPTLSTASGEHRNNLRAAVVPVVNYRATPHSDLKASYTYLRETRDGDSTRGEQRFEIVYAARFDSLSMLTVK